MSALDPLLREALIVVAVICLPVLGLAAFCGLVIAVLQAATQIQEQTLTLLPKVAAVGILVALFGPFAMRLCVSLLEDAVRAMPSIVLGT